MGLEEEWNDFVEGGCHSFHDEITEFCWSQHTYIIILIVVVVSR